MQQDNPQTIINTPGQGQQSWQEFPEAPPQGEPIGKARGIAREFRQAGTETIRRTKEQGEAVLGEQKHLAAETMHHCSDALRGAAQSLRDRRDPNLASFADTIAERLERTSNYLEAKQLGDIRNDVENFARNQPQVFYGAMFVAGLALSRLLKASQSGSGESVETRFANQIINP